MRACTRLLDNDNRDMTNAELRTLRQRIINLEEELQDPICKKYPTARMHVANELKKCHAQLPR